MGRMLVVIALLGGLTACSDMVEDLFLADIGNQWTVEGDPDHTFFFDPETSGRVESADFTGNEEFPGESAPIVDGHFEGRAIRFNSQRSTGTVSFAGTFRDENTMDIRGGGQTLVVRKGS
jgi:hypothetical protein